MRAPAPARLSPSPACLNLWTARDLLVQQLPARNRGVTATIPPAMTCWFLRAQDGKNHRGKYLAGEPVRRGEFILPQRKNLCRSAMSERWLPRPALLQIHIFGREGVRRSHQLESHPSVAGQKLQRLHCACRSSAASKFACFRRSRACLSVAAFVAAQRDTAANFREPRFGNAQWPAFRAVVAGPAGTAAASALSRCAAISARSDCSSATRSRRAPIMPVYR